MAGLRVLITNFSFVSRSGTEAYVRDLALGLLRRGHCPIVYSPKLGEIAQETQRATVPVVDNLEAIGAPPDVIHGHHGVETMTALLRFPGVPAVFFCHDWSAWQDTPPTFPRIRRYVAVDDTCRDRLVLRHGIPPARVRVIFNAVDLQRFQPRRPLPEQPRRALIFSNYASTRTHLPAVKQACDELGLQLDTVGLGTSGICTKPESMLADYDLVFAKGRCAWESLAVGTAVVLCDAAGVGPLVTEDRLDELRRLNFGRRTLQAPLDADLLKREIRRFDPRDAAEVSRRIRAIAGLDLLLDELLELYEQVRDEQLREPQEFALESRAAAAYFRWCADQFERMIEEARVPVTHRDKRSRLAKLYRSLAKRLPRRTDC